MPKPEPITPVFASNCDPCENLFLPPLDWSNDKESGRTDAVFGDANLPGVLVDQGRIDGLS